MEARMAAPLTAAFACRQIRRSAHASDRAAATSAVWELLFGLGRTLTCASPGSRACRWTS